MTETSKLIYCIFNFFLSISSASFTTELANHRYCAQLPSLYVILAFDGILKVLLILLYYTQLSQLHAHILSVTEITEIFISY